MVIAVTEPRVGYALKKHRLTAAEYLAWEETQPFRNEYVRGEVFAMTGGTDRNATVTGNLYILLRQHLRGTPCRAYVNDVKLRIDVADCFFYPDLMVTCSAADLADRLIKREPILVVEVLSPSTASFDRGEKFADYRELASLVEYLLIDVERKTCDLHRKGADGLWVLHPSRPDDPVVLDSVGLTIAAAELWADLEPDAPADQAASSGENSGSATPRGR